MLGFRSRAASDGLSDRKLRLFACAIASRIWFWLEDEASKRALQASERFADGQTTAVELAELERRAKPAWTQEVVTAYWPGWSVAMTVANVARQATGTKETALHSAFLRDIFGNPFRSVAADPA